MSIISSLAELFRRSAVPSVESTISQLENRVLRGLPALSAGEIRERAISNLTNLLGTGVTTSQQTLGTAIGRIQTALQRGAAIERGETVARQLIPVDPTLPIGTEFRYRVKVTLVTPDPLGIGPDQINDRVIPIDWHEQLTREQIREMALEAARSLEPMGDSPKLREFGEFARTQPIIDTLVEVISVYRSPIG